MTCCEGSQTFFFTRRRNKTTTKASSRHPPPHPMDPIVVIRVRCCGTLVRQGPVQTHQRTLKTETTLSLLRRNKSCSLLPPFSLLHSSIWEEEEFWRQILHFARHVPLRSLRRRFAPTMLRPTSYLVLDDSRRVGSERRIVRPGFRNTFHKNPAKNN